MSDFQGQASTRQNFAALLPSQQFAGARPCCQRIRSESRRDPRWSASRSARVLHANSDPKTDSHVKQVLNYLAASKLKLGLLVNFGEDSLKYKRVVL